MKYGCPVCNPDEDLDLLREDYEEGYVYVKFGGCGHALNLRDIEGSIEEQSDVKARKVEVGVRH